MPFISEKNEAGDFAKMLTRVDRRRALGVHRAAAPLSRAAFFCSGAAAHPPWAEFVDGSHPQGAWRKGTDGQQRLMLYSIENDGLRTRYWIIAEGERIQVPPEKIPQYTDHRPAALSLLAPLQRHPLVQCFIRGPEG
jgi:hypothetical protein